MIDPFEIVADVIEIMDLYDGSITEQISLLVGVPPTQAQPN